MSDQAESAGANDHLNKVLWPDDGLTRGDLVAYLRAVSSAFLPHCHDRPVTLVTYPRGIHGPSFYRRELPENAPATMRHARYETATNRHAIELPIIETIDDAL